MLKGFAFTFILFNKFLFAGNNVPCEEPDLPSPSKCTIDFDKVNCLFNICQISIIYPIIVDDDLMNFIHDTNIHEFIYGKTAYQLLKSFLLKQLNEQYEYLEFDIHEIEMRLKKFIRPLTVKDFIESYLDFTFVNATML